MADVKGLRGETGIHRLELNAQPGDAGGAVFDASGAVVGMLIPKSPEGPQLPENTSFSVDTATIAQLAAEAGLTLQGADGLGQMPPRALTRQAQDMTVLVSCWN